MSLKSVKLDTSNLVCCLILRSICGRSNLKIKKIHYEVSAPSHCSCRRRAAFQRSAAVARRSVLGGGVNFLMARQLGVAS